jgi:hypothetical protein
VASSNGDISWKSLSSGSAKVAIHVPGASAKWYGSRTTMAPAPLESIEVALHVVALDVPDDPAGRGARANPRLSTDHEDRDRSKLNRRLRAEFIAGAE